MKVKITYWDGTSEVVNVDSRVFEYVPEKGTINVSLLYDLLEERARLEERLELVDTTEGIAKPYLEGISALEWALAFVERSIDIGVRSWEVLE